MLKSSYCGLFIIIALQQLIFYTQGLEAKDSVPVLIWKDEKPPIQSPAVSSLMIPKALLQEKFLKAFNPDNILLFLQDELSVEDLSSHEEAFKHVNDFMENSHSLYLPTVEAKSSLAHSFSAQGYNVIKIEAGSSVGQINLKKGSKNLVLVQLPSTSTNLHRHKALQKTDEIIDNVISKIGKKAKFTVIFTGEKPSVKAVAELEHRRTSRSLQQIIAGTSNSTSMHYTQCVLLYLRNDLVLQKGNDTLTLYNNKTVTNIPDCHDYEDSIIINYKNVGQFDKLKVRFRFTRTERRWTLSDAEVTDGVNNVEKTMLFPIWAMEDVPLNKSFACAQKMTFKSNDTTDGKSVYYLYVNGMQVQAFTNGQKVFSAGWDCVGFFTIPIWTGIFTGIIMVIILAIALYMLSEVKTMDRFDDPKGKPIMVTGSNE